MRDLALDAAGGVERGAACACASGGAERGGGAAALSVCVCIGLAAPGTTAPGLLLLGGGAGGTRGGGGGEIGRRCESVIFQLRVS